MRQSFVCVFLLLSISGFLSAQHAVNPTNRYYRIIALVHLTGSGNSGDPILPEYIAHGTAVAEAALTAAATASKHPASPGTGSVTDTHTAATQPTQPPRPTPAPIPMPAPGSAFVTPVPRPGFLAWSMQKSDDGKMAIVHIVAADPSAFADIVADSRPEIRVFQIGKDSPATIQAEIQKYKKDFNLTTFEVPIQYSSTPDRPTDAEAVNQNRGR